MDCASAQLNFSVIPADEEIRGFSGLSTDQTKKLIETFPDAELRIIAVPATAENVGIMYELYRDFQKELEGKEKVEGQI